MKKPIYVFLSVALLTIAATMVSCTDERDDQELYYPTALVTVKPTSDAFILQLNDSVVLYPTNMTTSPYGDKEMRALVNYTTVSMDENTVRINWLDSIRTKQTEPSVGDNDPNEYGDDPIEIMRDWVTVAEDGYLTLRIRTLWGCGNQKHYLHLISGTNPDNPYELVLRHNAMGDTDGLPGDALIAFCVRDILSESSEPTQKLTIRWKSFTGEKSHDFEFINAQPKPQHATISRDAFPYSVQVE